ncbi:MAG: dynamin family protein [Bacteroidia bacterium]|nr:dynamin family protein [Bacteroidia bacterium]
MQKEEVFISYAWAPKTMSQKDYDKIIGSIESTLKKDFKVYIDKKDVKYKGSIRDFENRLGNGQKVVLIISDKYLRSHHCMYEVLKIKEYGNVYNRIFPIVLDCAKIHDSVQAADYIRHWEEEEQKLNETLKSLKSQANTQKIREDLDNCVKYRAIFDDFRGLLSNMNTLSPEIHQEKNFKELLNSLKDIKPKKKTKSQQEFTNRISQTKKLFEKGISLVEGEIAQENIKADDLLEKIKYFYNQCKSQSFQIAVMAMVKSGKSTFLNSLLGDEYLPMSNVPETSVFIKINHTQKGKAILHDGSKAIQGVSNIKAFIAAKNNVRREKGLKERVEFDLEAPFIVLNDKEMDGIKFEVLDTPGFGEALRKDTVGKSINQTNHELIDKTSAIIYLLDYSKLNTEDEKEVLERLSDVRSDILEKIQDRLFFIINQIDKEDRNSLPPEMAVDYVYKLVKDKMPKLNKEHIFHLSARNALLSRLILNGNATNEAKSDFGKIAFGVRANKIPAEQYIEAAEEILLDSKIEQIENKIINYIYENRSRIFIEGLLDNLKRLLKDFKNKFIVTAEGALNTTIEEIETLEGKIKEAKKKQESIQNQAEKFEGEIKSWIDEEFRKFEQKIIDNIESVFDGEAAEEKKKWYNRIIPGWVTRLQDKISQIFSSSTNSREDIHEKVKELNDEIHDRLYEQFVSFRGELELKLFNKQKELLENLQTTINNLAREFEGTVKKALKVNLETVELKLDIIDLDKILAEADSFLERFVKVDPKIDYELQEQQVYKEGTWCRQGRFETQYVASPVLKQEYSISKSSVEVFWKGRIQGMNNNAKKLTIHFIDNQIKREIKNARGSFDGYVEDYLSIIHSEKTRLSTEDKESIQIRIEKLKMLNLQVSEMIQQIELLSGRN